MAGASTRRPESSAPLFGRGEIIEEVDRLIDRAGEGHCQGLLIVGAGGAGKTSVLRAVVDRGTERDFLVLRGHALPEELPPPFALVRDLIRSMGEEEAWASTNAEGSTELPIFLAPFREGVGPHQRPFRTAPKTTTAEDDLEQILAPLGRSTIEGVRVAREKLLVQVEEYFHGLARERPLLLAIDDLHLADTSSLEFLWRFAVDLPETAAIVVATIGTGPETPQRTRAALETLSRSRPFRSMPLRALDVPEVADFVRWILDGRVPDAQDVLRWHAQAEGNPLLIEQLVRAETGYGPAGSRGAPAQSRDVTEILVARVRGLSEYDRRVLTYAAVLGKEFVFSNLEAVAGGEEERVTESLDRLVRAGLLRDKGDEVYEFVTEAVRASVYAHLTETRRRILHRKAGLALEENGGVGDSELARHFYLGRDNDRAVKFNVAAAQSATRALALETAVTYIARALEAERRRPERDVRTEIRFLTEEGRLLIEMSTARSEEVLAEAVALARARPGHELELGRALLGLAQSRYRRGEYLSAEELATEAWAYLATAGTIRDRIDAHRVLGVSYMRQGELRQAEAHQRTVLELAQRDGTPFEQGHALIEVANLMQAFGPSRFDSALEMYAQAAKLFGTGNDYGAQARVLMNRAVLEWTAGRTDEALQDLTLAIDAADRSRSPRWIGYCHLNLAQLQTELGRTELARPALERAVQVLAPVGDGFADQQIMMTRGMIAHADRAFDAAEANYQDSLSKARHLHLPSETSEVLWRLAQLFHDRGDDTRSRERLAEARANGLLDHHPDFAPRVAALEKAITVTPDSDR